MAAPENSLLQIRPNSSVSARSSYSGLPRIFIEEEQNSEQYHIRAAEGRPNGSSLTLNNWKPLDRIPQRLLDSAEAEWFERTSTYSDGQSHRSTGKLKRIGAWIKRSGKRLVVRVEKKDRSEDQRFTDIHLYEKPELEGQPILPPYSSAESFERNLAAQNQLYLYTNFHDTLSPEELHGSPRSELPDSPIQELPTAHNLTELAAIHHNSTADESASPDISPFDDCPRRLNVPTSGGTFRSNLSSADTAVSSVEETDISSGMGGISTIARGLSLVGSVKYRCTSNGEPHVPRNEEPTKAVSASYDLKTSSVSEKKLASIRRPKQANGESREKAIKAPPACDDITNPETQEGLKNAMASVSTPGMRTVYGSISINLLYQQDLHTASNVQQSPSLPLAQTNGPDAILATLYGQQKDLRQPLRNTRVHTSDGELQNASNALKDFHVLQDATNDKSNAEAKSGDVYTDSSGDREGLDRFTPLCSDVTSNEEPARVTKSSPTAPEDPEPLVNSENNKAQGSITSPISPLTEEEQSTTNNASQIAPITPMTPAKTVASNLMALDSTIAEGGSDNNTQSVEGGTVPSNGSLDEITNRSKNMTDGPASTPSNEDPVDETHAESQFSNVAQSSEVEAQDECTPSVFPPPPALSARNASDIQNSVPHLADFVDYQKTTAPPEPIPVPPLDFLSDDKIPMKYKNLRFKGVPQLDTSFVDRSPPTAISQNTSIDEEEDVQSLLDTGRPEPARVGTTVAFFGLVVSALTNVALRNVLWLQRNTGQEPPVPEHHVRVRWTCTCGENLYDDFVELRPGAANLLEAQLNRRIPQPYSAPRSSSRSSPASFRSTPNGTPSASSATSLSSTPSRHGTPSRKTSMNSRTISDDDTLRDGDIFPFQGSRYLLTCVSEAKNTPRLSHLPLHKANILSDKDLAVALRDHYSFVNRSWYRRLRLRGLTSIEFVQFYKHRNNFADIRKCPSVPSEDVPHDYEFDPSDVLPPVGSHYLVHLFQHLYEYDDETVAYLSIPKKTARLQGGIGWGIKLTEGFLLERIWIFILSSFVLFGCVFLLVWTVREHDLQGAFGVASFVTTLVTMVFGFLQACLG